MRKPITLSLFVASALAVGLASQPSFAQQKFVSIGTGGVTGVYYPTGGAICRLVNKARKEHGIRCSVESTGGSAYNVNAIRAGELEMGVAQSDVQYNAMKGVTSKFEAAGPDPDLRAVFSVHPEPLQVFARADSGINKIMDIKGMRFNIGEPGSGTVAGWETWSAALGISNDDLKLASELKTAEVAQALCDNKIDAFGVFAGIPAGFGKEVATTCDVKVVEVDDPKIVALADSQPFLAMATVPGGTYNGNPDDVTTYGVKATFVSSAKVPEEMIYQVVKAVFDNFETFKKLHPAFNHLTEESMIKEGNSAPLHDGAVKYYKERGWM